MDYSGNLLKGRIFRITMNMPGGAKAKYIVRVKEVGEYVGGYIRGDFWYNHKYCDDGAFPMFEIHKMEQLSEAQIKREKLDAQVSG